MLVNAPPDISTRLPWPVCQSPVHPRLGNPQPGHNLLLTESRETPATPQRQAGAGTGQDPASLSQASLVLSGPIAASSGLPVGYLCHVL